MPVDPTDALAALANPTRRAIFEHLTRAGELSVRSITDEAGISQPAVSKHLGILVEAGLAQTRPAGRLTYYSACPAGLEPLQRWIERHASAR